MTQPPAGYYRPAQLQTTCTWHPDRVTALSCSRCGRPACPECLTPASVGFHCRQCVAEAQAERPVARTISGGVHGAQPIVSYVLIGINVLIFLVVLVQGGGESTLYDSAVLQDGALIPAAVGGGEWWRLVTSGFLHLSLIHLAMNMLALYMIGVGLERVLGPVRFTAVYLLSLLGGSVAVYLLSAPVTLTAGASGAIFGLLGALAVTLRRLQLDLRRLGIIIALNLFITVTVPGISWQAHVGGFIVGALVGAAMVFPPAAARTRWQWGVGAGVLVALVALILVRDTTVGDWVCSANACRQIG